MVINAKCKRVIINGESTDYITFGKGNKNLIIIPGLGDAIKTVKGMAKSFSYIYKEFGNDYKVYIISRRNNISKGFSISMMADDINSVMDKLNITNASIIGISQGGMIAQELAIKYPNRVNKLVLAVTSARNNEVIDKVVNNWIECAKKKDYKSIVIDIAERSYTAKRLKKYRKLYKVLYRIGRPKNYDRFIIQAESCLNHDSYDNLSKIKVKTLIIGARLDKIVGVDASIELHKKIKDSQLYIYEKFGHGVYEYIRNFNNRIIDFLKD